MSARPWNDLPACRKCKETVCASLEHLPTDHLYCFACGHTWKANAEELAHVARCDALWVAELKRQDEVELAKKQAAEDLRKYELAKAGKLW